METLTAQHTIDEIDDFLMADMKWLGIIPGMHAIRRKNEIPPSLSIFATPAHRALMEDWRILHPQWWLRNMQSGSEVIRFENEGIRIGPRFVLGSDLYDGIISFADAMVRIDDFAPIEKYIECMRCMPSGSLLQGSLEERFLKGEAIREFWKLVARKGDYYWSSTTLEHDQKSVWFINFDAGYIAENPKDDKLHILYIK